MDLESEGRLASEAADRAGLGIIVARLAPFRVTYANASALGMAGMSAPELYACTALDFVAPEQRDVIEDRVRRRLAGEQLPPAQLTFARPDGSRVEAQVHLADLVIDGGASIVMVITRTSGTAVGDLASDARYRDLVDAAPDGVAITRGTRFLYANKACLALVGCPSAAELPRYSLSEIIAADDIPVMMERLTGMYQEGAHFPPRDYVIRVMGRDKVVEVSSVRIEFAGGPAVLAFVRDVTEARRAQAELDRTQRLTALGTLAAGVAHEVNNPLAFARIGAEMLARFLDNGCQDKETGRAALSNVISGLDRIATIVRELRAFIRCEEGVLVPIELSEVIASSVRFTQSVIRSRATLDIDLDALPCVRSSPGRLEQVFVNLLINAAQSFVRDDVSTNIVRVRASRMQGEVAISVEDNGRGIRPEHLPRIFDPFFTTKPAGEGTGLGLSICHTILTKHNGRIAVSSIPEQGTKVTVFLPAEDDLCVAPAVASKLSPKTSHRTRVLIVDDEPTFGQLLRGMLAPAHDVVVATSGLEAEALLLASERPFDVVLCDIPMSDISGDELFNRTCARRPELGERFVFMTAGVFDDEALERVGGGAAPRIEKPFSFAAVADVIARVVRRHDS